MKINILNINVLATERPLLNNTWHLNTLNKHQLEILKLFSRELEDEDLIAIKKLIVKYLADKITKMADEIWEENNWTNDDMDRLLKTHKRTPYNPKN